MSENGHSQTQSEPKKSVASEVIDLIDDHIELASLELQYETEQGLHRMVALVIGLVLALCAFGFLQIAIVEGLVRLGVPTWAAAIGLAVLYGGVAALCFQRFLQRPAKAGEPFQGTRAEIRKNLRWIQQFFS